MTFLDVSWVSVKLQDTEKERLSGSEGEGDSHNGIELLRPRLTDKFQEFY